MISGSDKLYEQIESWLDGRLQEQEAAAFAARLEKDEDLRERVEQHRLARLAIDGWVAENYKDQATLWREAMELQEKALAKRKRLWWIVGLSALALIICVIAFGVFKKRINEDSSPQTPEETIVPVPKQLSGDTDKYQINSSVGSGIPSLTNDRSSKKTPQKVKPGRKKASSKPKERKMADQEAIAYADENLKDYWAIVEERTRGISRSASSPGHFEFGCQAYSKEDWPKAEQELLQVKSQDGGDFTNALELLAIVAFKQKKYAEAALYYEQFAPRKIGPATDWRLVLYYLADYPARKNELYTSLEKILQSSEHPFKEQAKQLEIELRRNK